ncbi:MAG: hypothetical protein ACJ764_10695 [Solirubrobacteraceae bacterium]
MGQLLLAAAVLAGLLALAWHFTPAPRSDALHALPDALRVIFATAGLFAIAGFGLVRLLLPAPLRRHELLWVLPTGGCAVGLAMTVLGFAYVPYPVSLILVVLAGVALGVFAVHRRGWPPVLRFSASSGAPRERRGLGWPIFLALVVLAVALVPMLCIQQYPAPVGDGSDAHVATGVAQFLQHDHPTAVDISQPIQRMQPTWQSKYPIYYAFAAVSTLSGLATWQVLSTLTAVMLALTAIGLFLVAREMFGAPRWVALVAMCLAALDREALHTVIHPYFNQTWGFFALPFTLVLGWWALQPGLDRADRRGAIGLLALFALVLALAYPLAAPIPAIPLLIFALLERRRRIAAGQRVFRARDLYHGRRSLFWMVPVAVLLAVPVVGAADKAVSAVQALAPGHVLSGSWAGDLPGPIPWDNFFSLPNSVLGTAALVAVLALAVWGLSSQPRALAWGLGGLLVLGLLTALYFRQRHNGFYFEFKLLAFLGPLVLLMAALGAGRLRVLGVAAMAGLVALVAGSAVAEIKITGHGQLPPQTVQLAQWARSLPRNASIRLDMFPPDEIWAAYFLISHPVCSQRPLLNTDYPHVIYSRKADYILVRTNRARPRDALGPPLRQDAFYLLYRESPAVPGVDTCSRRRFDRIYTGLGRSRY